MRPFRVLEGAAAGDLAFEASGKDLSGLFTNAAKGLERLMIDPASVKKVVARKVNIQAENTNELLYKFLSDLVFFRDTYQLVFTSFKVKVGNDGRSLSGLLQGEIIDKKRHKLIRNIKAVAKRHFDVAKRSGVWTAKAVLETGK